MRAPHQYDVLQGIGFWGYLCWHAKFHKFYWTYFYGNGGLLIGMVLGALISPKSYGRAADIAFVVGMNVLITLLLVSTTYVQWRRVLKTAAEKKVRKEASRANHTSLRH
jgi:hypothetical protein